MSAPPRKLRTPGGGPRRPAARLFVALSTLALLLAATAAPARAQGDGEPEEVPAVDPYTEGEAEALERLGYVSFGPFAFGDEHDSDAVVRTLGGIPMLWVETAHFRLGCTLEPYTVAQDQDERGKIKDELKRLKKRGLKRVKTSARELDRWLLLHLWAQRLEELYAAFEELLGVSDADFARGGPAAGEGPYLGQKSKFTVLLLQKESGLGRYTGHYLGQESRYSLRWSFHRTGTMFFGAAYEALRGTYANDTALHCSVAHGVAENFVDGFRAFGFQTPVWWKLGIAHTLARAVDPRFNVYGGGLGTPGQDEDGWDWEPRVRARVGHDYFPDWDKLLGWSAVEDLKDPDHMMAWSRVQHLLQDRDAARAFMIALKEPLPRGADVPAALAERQRRAIPECWGQSLDALEREWARWVERRYRDR